MPDFYAHQVFGEKVLEALPVPERTRIQNAAVAWQCGLYGPDPLFFYHPLKRQNPLCKEGHDLHHCPPETVLNRYRSEAALHIPYADGYAAGFLCHYVLDAACHPIVLRFAEGHFMGHSLVEGAFDQFLTPKGERGLPTSFPKESPAYAAAAIAYANANAEEYRLALKYFCEASRGMSWLRRIHPVKRRYHEAIEELSAALTAAVPRCAELICTLLDALDTGKDLSFLPNTDFSGNPLPNNRPLPEAQNVS